MKWEKIKYIHQVKSYILLSKEFANIFRFSPQPGRFRYPSSFVIS